MSELRTPQEPVQEAPAVAPPIYFDARRELASRYLFGEGLEIGALHLPLTMPAGVEVRYVDRKSVADLRAEYPELEEWNLTEVDLLDDGELLSTIADESQDFIVANHFLEHCENPIGTILHHLGKLRAGGVLFYAVPDKRFTFDFRRDVTPLEHMIADYEHGPEHSRREHYDEWVRLVSIRPGEPNEQATARARELERVADSIHMHVWTQVEFLQLIFATRERCDQGFEIEASARQQIEFMVVLRKNGPLPTPHAEVVAEAATAVVPAAARLRGKVRALVSRLVHR
jgi:SAM-dependent methyltransferase